MLTLLLIFCVTALIIGFLVFPGESSLGQRAPFWGVNHAHRGLHTHNQSIPENSIAAFTAAVDAGYGIELDVQLSKDGEVVVFHDDDLLRACGVQKKVDELTYDELSELYLFDTQQKIPLLKDVLKTVDMRVPLIIELKTGKNNKELCRATWRLLRQYDGDICIESFDPMIVRWFKKYVPGLLRGQLAAHPFEKPYTLKRIVAGLCLANFLSRPHFIAYEKGERPLIIRVLQKFCMSVVWTANQNDDAPSLEMENDAVIFEYYEPEPRYIELPQSPKIIMADPNEDPPV